MYGILNQAIVAFLEGRAGADGLREIRQRSGVTDNFIGMQPYPDSTSIDLLVAAAEHLGIELDQLLEEVGEAWVGFILNSPFGDHLKFAGSDYVEVLQSLDDMHWRLAQEFAGYDPPSFTVQVVGEGQLSVLYSSSRAGLAPLALGILRRLARAHDEVVEIQGTPSADGYGATFAISGVSGVEFRESA